MVQLACLVCAGVVLRQGESVPAIGDVLLCFAGGAIADAACCPVRVAKYFRGDRWIDASGRTGRIWLRVPIAGGGVAAIVLGRGPLREIFGRASNSQTRAGSIDTSGRASGLQRRRSGFGIAWRASRCDGRGPMTGSVDCSRLVRHMRNRRSSRSTMRKREKFDLRRRMSLMTPYQHGEVADQAAANAAQR